MAAINSHPDDELGTDFVVHRASLYQSIEGEDDSYGGAVYSEKVENRKYARLKLLWNKYGLALVVFIAAMVMMVMRSIDSVIFVRMTKKMKNYNIYLNSILLNTIFNVIFWPIVWYRMFISKKITPEMRKFPLRQFFIMGIFDCMISVITTMTSSYVSGPVNIVVSQSVVVVNMILSFVFLGSRYNALHYGGVLVVMIGVIIDVLPLFNSSNSSGSTQWLWIIILIVGSIPDAAGDVYKEKCMKKVDLDIWYVQAWTMFWQWIFGLITFPIVMIPFPKPYESIKIQDIPLHVWGGMKCTIGINSLATDRCSYFWVLLIVYIVFNLIFNYLLLYVFKYGSSTLATIASAARLAVTNVGFLIPVLAGEAAVKRLTGFDIEALVILLMGVVLFSVTKQTTIEDFSLKEYIKSNLMRVRTRLFHKADDEDVLGINYNQK